MDPIDEIKAEILRLRERQHSTESKVVGLEFIVNDLREWRAEMRHRIDHIDESLEKLVNSEAIEQAERKLQLTLAQKLVALLVGAVALADAIRGLVGM